MVNFDVSTIGNYYVIIKFLWNVFQQWKKYYSSVKLTGGRSVGVSGAIHPCRPKTLIVSGVLLTRRRATTRVLAVQRIAADRGRQGRRASDRTAGGRAPAGRQTFKTAASTEPITVLLQRWRDPTKGRKILLPDRITYPMTSRLRWRETRGWRRQAEIAWKRKRTVSRMLRGNSGGHRGFVRYFCIANCLATEIRLQDIDDAEAQWSLSVLLEILLVTILTRHYVAFRWQ